MLDAEILTTFSLVSPNPADLGWFPLGLSWRWGVMSLHLHWYKIPFSLTAISSVLSEAILTNRNLSLALDFSGQNSRSSPSHNGVWFAPESPAEIKWINFVPWLRARISFVMTFLKKPYCSTLTYWENKGRDKGRVYWLWLLLAQTPPRLKILKFWIEN